MDGHAITMLGTGLIADFYTNTLHGQRGRDRVRIVYSRNAERGAGGQASRRAGVVGRGPAGARGRNYGGTCVGARAGGEIIFAVVARDRCEPSTAADCRERRLWRAGGSRWVSGQTIKRSH